MKFVLCSEEPHAEATSANAPVNLDLCATFNLGSVGGSLRNPCADTAGIVFDMYGIDRCIRWTFANEDARNREFSRLLNVAIHPDDSEIIKGLFEPA